MPALVPGKQYTNGTSTVFNCGAGSPGGNPVMHDLLTGVFSDIAVDDTGLAVVTGDDSVHGKVVRINGRAFVAVAKYAFDLLPTRAVWLVLPQSGEDTASRFVDGTIVEE